MINQYVAQCALSMTCRELALAGLFLARDGVLSDSTRLLSARQTKRVNAVMLTCGTYDSAGEFAYRVGLPAKSGVGGGILAVILTGASPACGVPRWAPPAARQPGWPRWTRHHLRLDGLLSRRERRTTAEGLVTLIRHAANTNARKAGVSAPLSPPSAG